VDAHRKDDLSSSSGQGRAQVRSRKPASGSIVLLRLERAFDLQILCSVMGAAESSVHEVPVNASLPNVHGGQLSIQELANGCAFSAAECECILECLAVLSATPLKSAQRRSIFTRTKNAAAGEEILVVHVYEVLSPLAQPLHRAGHQKAVLGEYIDGKLHVPAGSVSNPAALERARADFDNLAVDKGSDTISLDQLWLALGKLDIGHGHNAQVLLADVGAWERSAALRRLAGGERMARDDFVELARCLMHRDEAAAAAADSGPGVDLQWAMTRHTFEQPGEHTISWHGLELFAGWAPSNTLRINIVPRLKIPSLSSIEARERLHPAPPILARAQPNKPRPKTLGGVPKAACVNDDDYVMPLKKYYFGPPKTKSASGSHEVWI